jgi:hypothetical protein
VAWRIVVQPNGKYARFADPVDHFTTCDMTREEAVEECQQYPGMGRQEAEEKVKRAEDDPRRFQDCLKTIELIHGSEEALAYLAKLS